MLKKPSILSKIQKGEKGLILDRGFRDETTILQSLGSKVFMPNLLTKGKSDLVKKQPTDQDQGGSPNRQNRA